MAGANQDRIDSLKEKIHGMRSLLEIKPDMTLKEYLEQQEKLLEELKKH